MRQRECQVYFLRPVGLSGPVKIGSSLRAHDRLRTYAFWSPLPLEVAATLPGGEELERRFHALFARLHSHHEWFHAAPELTATIEAIRAGAFDASTLPPATDLRHIGRSIRRSAIEAGVFTRRAERLRQRGVAIPADVKDCMFTYGHEPAEVDRRRAVVRSWVLTHDPRPVGGAAA